MPAVGDDAVACADALVGLIDAERRVVAQRFAQVAAWADLRGPGFELPGDQPDAAALAARREPGYVGGEGTPPVSTAGTVELGVLLQTSTYSAQRLLGDVLDLRHRLSEHWEAVLTGRLDGWKAREVARLTRPLATTGREPWTRRSSTRSWGCRGAGRRARSRPR